MKIPNALIHSSSPYLLQHAYNPVQWYPWGEEALKKARDENKLLIISIGYSACHWCHVMEHESFEDEEVATVMNKSFVCIKVDREERPDIDHIYMDALQLMTGRGGWPLNVITLPDQRPVYGGTYFPKEQWRKTLLQLAAFFRNDPEKFEEYARELTEGLLNMNKMLVAGDQHDRTFPDHSDMLHRWSTQWDREEGGALRAPKFPLPDSYRYMLVAAKLTGNTEAQDHVCHTLNKMAFGGIYDQVGGGFARYSTDMLWKVPHFEKMLYDNALLVSLYADAFKLTKKKLYKDVLQQTLGFIAREMTAPSGGFYAALDADSEGVEGKYYCWNPDELKAAVGDDFKMACDYFGINERGYWEHDMYIPLRPFEEEEFAQLYGLELPTLQERIKTIRSKMLAYREKRVRPGLDNKMLCSWNALMLSAYLDAYSALGTKELFDAAGRNAAFIRKYFLFSGSHLMHTAKEFADEVKVTIPAFLEDYAFVVEAFIALYTVTMDSSYLQDAIQLTETAMSEFYDEGSGLFWFTSSRAEKLITRKHEIQDNVIPSSTAVMFHNLLRLSRLTGNLNWESACRSALVQVKSDTVLSTPWYSRWARVFLELEQGTEIAVSGPDAFKVLNELLTNYLPLSVVAASETDSELMLLKNRFVPESTFVYVCRNQSCQRPVVSADEAMQLINFD